MSNNGYDIQYNKKDTSRHQNKNSQLDIEFDQILASMKKYVLDLKDKKCKILVIFSCSNMLSSKLFSLNPGVHLELG